MSKTAQQSLALSDKEARGAWAAFKKCSSTFAQPFIALRLTVFATGCVFTNQKRAFVMSFWENACNYARKN